MACAPRSSLAPKCGFQANYPKGGEITTEHNFIVYDTPVYLMMLKSYSIQMKFKNFHPSRTEWLINIIDFAIKNYKSLSGRRRPTFARFNRFLLKVLRT